MELSMRLPNQLFLMILLFTVNSPALVELSGAEVLTKPQIKLATELSKKIGFQGFLIKGSFNPNSVYNTFAGRLAQKPELMNSQPDPVLIEVGCSKNLELNLYGDRTDAAAAVFSVFRKMGFLFPKPGIIIGPGDSWRSLCGKKTWWRPRFRDRGFHMHTQHPSEFVDMAFHNNLAMQESYLSWLTVNGQNTLQVQMLRSISEEQWVNLTRFMNLSRTYGFRFGLGVSFSMIQQNSYYLIQPWRSFFSWGAGNQLVKNLKNLNKKIQPDFLTFEIGTTEFSSTNYQRTLNWIELIQSNSRTPIFFKIHASSNQFQEPWGNFNFLPAFAEKNLGLLPHTIHFYGLKDSVAPVYGRSDFFDMADFIKQQRVKKLIWYFPETSYYIGLDIDVPLFLTDYLVARSEDIQFLSENMVAGHLSFTTGLENGYWLFDWAVMLWTDLDNPLSPELPFVLLKEDPTLVRSLLKFQTEWIKLKQIIQLISAENLMDQLPFSKPIHERILLKDLMNDPDLMRSQVVRLEQMLADFPSFNQLKNAELANHFQLLNLKIQHALAIRKAYLGTTSWVQAEKIESQAKEILRKQPKIFANSLAWKKQPNVTVYDEGYGYTSESLHFWIRERSILQNKIQNPFFMNIYDPIKIVFGYASPALPTSLRRHLVQ